MPKATKRPTTSRLPIAKVRCRLRDAALSSRDIRLALQAHPDAEVFRVAKACVEAADEFRPLYRAMLEARRQKQSAPVDYPAAKQIFEHSTGPLWRVMPTTPEGAQAIMQAVLVMAKSGRQDVGAWALHAMHWAIRVGV